MYSTASKYLKSTAFKYENAGNIFLTLGTLTVALCAIVVVKLAWKRNKYINNKMTRKLKLFDFWGNSLDLIRNARFDRLPSNVYIMQTMMGYCQLFKQEQFYFFWLSFWPFIVATKAKAVEELISGSKNMEKSWFYEWMHPWLGTGLLTSAGGKWKSRRKLLTPAFHFEILKDFLPIFNEQSQVLVQMLKEETKKPWVNIMNPVTLCSLDIVCETTLGVSIGAQKDSESEYVQAVSRASNMVMQRFVNPLYYFDWCFNLSPDGFQFKKDVKLLHAFTRKVITDKKAKLLSRSEDTSNKKRKALMDLLLDQHLQNKALTEEDIREEVDTFAFEGHDTTSMGMSWALYLIGLYKDVQEKLHEEMDRIFGDDCERDVTKEDLTDMEYLDRVLKESQRLYPSVPSIARKLSGDLTICGTKIPEGANASILVYALHRDESVFPNPEKFDPDRFLPENSVNRSPYAYIPFSAGPRNCIGQKFAIMEEKVVISNILRNFTLESLDPRDKVIINPELILRAATDIRVKFTPRRPTSY